MMCRAWGLRYRGFAHKEISGSITIWRPPVREPEQFAQCTLVEGYSMFMLIIFWQILMSSGFHSSRIALFRTKCMSNALAICAIATCLMAQGRGSNRYVSRSPTISSQNQYCLFRNRKQSTSRSTSSHRAKNSCVHTRV